MWWCNLDRREPLCTNTFCSDAKMSLSLVFIHLVSLHLCNPDLGKETKSLRSKSFCTPHNSLTLRLICFSASIICARHCQNMKKVIFSWIDWSEPKSFLSPSIFIQQLFISGSKKYIFIYFSDAIILFYRQYKSQLLKVGMKWEFAIFSKCMLVMFFSEWIIHACFFIIIKNVMTQIFAWNDRLFPCKILQSFILLKPCLCNSDIYYV